jgi:hypothetical protein
VLKEGQLCHANHFILKGCLRMHSITERARSRSCNLLSNTGGSPII